MAIKFIPKTLFDIQGFVSAPCGTIIATPNDAPIIKSASGYWMKMGLEMRVHYLDSLNTEFPVLRWGWGTDVPQEDLCQSEI